MKLGWDDVWESEWCEYLELERQAEVADRHWGDLVDAGNDVEAKVAERELTKVLGKRDRIGSRWDRFELDFNGGPGWQSVDEAEKAYRWLASKYPKYDFAVHSPHGDGFWTVVARYSTTKKPLAESTAFNVSFAYEQASASSFVASNGTGTGCMLLLLGLFFSVLWLASP